MRETWKEEIGTQETEEQEIRAERRGGGRPGGRDERWREMRFFADSDTKREVKFSCRSNLSAAILSERQLTGIKGRKSGKKAENFQIIIAKAGKIRYNIPCMDHTRRFRILTVRTGNIV